MSTNGLMPSCSLKNGETLIQGLTLNKKRRKEKKSAKKNRWKRKIAEEERRSVDLMKTEVVRQLQEDKAAEVYIAPKMPNLSRLSKMVEAAKKIKMPKGNPSNFL